jgi:hypothetical protein
MIKSLCVKNFSVDELKSLAGKLNARGYKWANGMTICLEHLQKWGNGQIYYLHFEGKRVTHYWKQIDNSELITINELFPMTKDQLKPGMIVVCNDAHKYLVAIAANQLFLMGLYGHEIISHFNDDLTCSVNPNFTIDKVYKTTGFTCMETMIDLDERFVELIWERKEVVVTMDEIAKLVGCNVSQLKIVK